MKQIVYSLYFLTISVFLAAALTACGAATEIIEDVSIESVPSAAAVTTPAPTPTAEPVAAYTPDWQIEPYLEAARIVGLPENINDLNQQIIFSHLAIQIKENGGWQFLNFKTGEVFPDTVAQPHFFATLGGELPFFYWVPDPYDAVQQKMVEQISAQQGIDLAYEGAGTFHSNPPVWFDNQWLSLGVYPNGLAKFDNEWNPLEFPAPLNVVLYIEPNSPDWQATSVDAQNSDVLWYYIGNGSGKYYDGVFLVDSNGDRIDDVLYEDGQPYREGVAALKLNGKWGYVDAAGFPITEFCYEPMISADSFSMEPTVAYCANEGFIPVKKNGLCGVIDTQGQEVVPLIFEDITSVYQGAVWAKQDGKWGLLKLPTT